MPSTASSAARLSIQNRSYVRLESDPGELDEYSGEVTFCEGILSFHVQAGDSTKMTFTGTLSGPTDLSGDFSATAWAVIKDALSGSWELARQAP